MFVFIEIFRFLFETPVTAACRIFAANGFVPVTQDRRGPWLVLEDEHGRRCSFLNKKESSLMAAALLPVIRDIGCHCDIEWGQQ